MKKTKIIYWIITGLFGAFMLFSAIPDIILSKDAVGIFNVLGYPLYISPFLGVAKVLGVIGILIPGYPRIKEWSYAGLLYDLAGATYSIIYTAKSTVQWLPMIPFLLLGVVAYLYYRKYEKMKRAQSGALPGNSFAV